MVAAVSQVGGWDFLVSKADLGATERRERGRTPLQPGEVRADVESFALTANNITYGAAGDSFGYWRFFPAPEGFGRIPVWGYARVSESANPDIEVGQRLFGYLPMSSDFTLKLERRADGFVDAAQHRAGLPPTYNHYQAAEDGDPDEDYRSLLRPLLMTSWLLDDFIAGLGPVATLVLSSASSKTALGLAWLTHRRGIRVIGLTSPANIAFLESLPFFDQVLTYAGLDGLEAAAPAVLVDFAGNPGVMGGVHHRLGDRLIHSAIVGMTHWDVERPPTGGVGPSLPGPAPTLFFAPDQIRKRAAEWGMAEFGRRFTEAMGAFVADNKWLRLERHKGAEGLQAAYGQVLAGKADPAVGHIIIPA